MVDKKLATNPVLRLALAHEEIPALVLFGERTGQACQDCLENRSVGDELAWGQDLHSPHFYLFRLNKVVLIVIIYI